MAINAAVKGDPFERYIEEIRSIWGDGERGVPFLTSWAA